MRFKRYLQAEDKYEISNDVLARQHTRYLMKIAGLYYHVIHVKQTSFTTTATTTATTAATITAATTTATTTATITAAATTAT